MCGHILVLCFNKPGGFRLLTTILKSQLSLVQLGPNLNSEM